MTFSILVRDPDTNCLGIAVASRFFAVGAICPFVFPGLGALSTQGAGHPPFAHAAEQLLREGHDSQTVLDRLLGDDPERERRQIHLLDRHGDIAAFSGSDCGALTGHRAGRDASVAGNMLTSEAVLDAALAGLERGDGIAARLLSALTAAQAAGGDKRGEQAAALLIYGSRPFSMLSLRVDDDANAVATLAGLLADAGTDYIPYTRRYFSAAENKAVFGP